MTVSKTSKSLSGDKGLAMKPEVDTLPLAVRLKESSARLLSFAGVNVTLLNLTASAAETLEEQHEHSGPLAVAREIEALAVQIAADSRQLVKMERRS